MIKCFKSLIVIALIVQFGKIESKNEKFNPDDPHYFPPYRCNSKKLPKVFISFHTINNQTKNE
jgi:hypothetical protein